MMALVKDKSEYNIKRFGSRSERFIFRMKTILRAFNLKPTKPG